MTRITRSAKTLVTQILDRYPDAAISNGDEPDGLGVHRQLLIEEPVGKPLFDLLLPIAQTDRRIAEIRLDHESGSLTVTFAADRYADLNDLFPLHKVEAVQNEAQTDEVGVSGDDKPKVDEPPTQDPKGSEGDSKPAKKAAAKKASS